jgi:predicted TIM-barrel fold metal-dependent hydrolase
VLNPAFLRESLDAWMGYVPVSKLMFSNDATSVEMAAGAADITRRAVWDAVSRRGGACGLDAQAVGETVKDMLHNNAARLYGGDPV